MIKQFTSLGLMSGTSGDGVDASIIQSDGNTKYEIITDKYFEYDDQIYHKIHQVKERINLFKDLEKNYENLRDLERSITLFHSRIVKELSENKIIDLVGFHGQTIYHNPEENISKQLGDGKLLSQLTKKNVVFNFRKKDIDNGGEGAPLTPIFHQLIASQFKISLPLCIMNIGGISNVTIIKGPVGTYEFDSRDIGPGNCLIDSWIRKNSKKKFDLDGVLASKGLVNEIILEQGQELFSNRLKKNKISLDVNDFDISFVRGLSLEDGAATLTSFSAGIISESLSSLLSVFKNKNIHILICGGGRKNKYLIDQIKKDLPKNFILKPIDDFGINGDFIESQAFAFLGIRSFLKLPITFPSTTRCKQPTTGGEIIKFK